MNKVYLFVIFLFFSACSSDNSSGPGNTEKNYFPLAVGNYWYYDSNEDNIRYYDSIQGVVKFDGNIYYIYNKYTGKQFGDNEITSVSTSFYRVEGNKIYELIILDPLDTLAEEVYDFSSPKNTKWEHYFFNSSDSIWKEFVITDKLDKISVKGKEYTDIIKIEFTIVRKNIDTGDETINKQIYYFANNTGIVKKEISEDVIRQLETYKLNN